MKSLEQLEPLDRIEYLEIAIFPLHNFANFSSDLVEISAPEEISVSQTIIHSSPKSFIFVHPTDLQV